MSICFPYIKQFPGQVVANAKVKVPNLLLKFNIDGLGLADKTGNIMYIPTYMYIRDNKEKDIYNIFRDKFYSKYIKKERLIICSFLYNSIYIFNSLILINIIPATIPINIPNINPENTNTGK